MFNSVEEIFAALRQANLSEDDAKLLSAQAKPCVWLRTAKITDENSIPMGTTKIGGRPDLPEGQAWPWRTAYPDAAYRAWSDERVELLSKPFPLYFVTQYNLAEARTSGPIDPDLPPAGLLSIFFDIVEQPWGSSPDEQTGGKVLFHELGAEKLTRRDHPAEFAEAEDYAPLDALSCAAQFCLTPIPVDSTSFEKLDLSKHTKDLYSKWWFEDERMSATFDGDDWKCHRFGGWPTPVQGDMQALCALVVEDLLHPDKDAEMAARKAKVRQTADEWLLLAQIGTDQAAGMMWGDMGQLYVWIRREDLRARNFDAAQFILECY